MRCHWRRCGGFCFRKPCYWAPSVFLGKKTVDLSVEFRQIVRPSLWRVTIEKWAVLTAGPTLRASTGRHEGREGRCFGLLLASSLVAARDLFSGLFLSRLHRREVQISRDRVRVNDQIRISPVRLIQDDGEQIGIVSIDEARERAGDRGMDLVEVAAEARPPVVKMMDYGKYKYEKARADREARKKQHTIKVKEVKFRPGIEDHDYEFKVGHARRFLEEGNKVKLTMMFRGRQVTHPEIGLQVLSRVMEDLGELGKVESQPNMEGRVMSMVVAPVNTK